MGAEIGPRNAGNGKIHKLRTKVGTTNEQSDECKNSSYISSLRSTGDPICSSSVGSDGDPVSSPSVESDGDSSVGSDNDSENDASIGFTSASVQDEEGIWCRRRSLERMHIQIEARKRAEQSAFIQRRNIKYVVYFCIQFLEPRKAFYVVLEDHEYASQFPRKAHIFHVP
jgi:hypothetical protein